MRVCYNIIDRLRVRYNKIMRQLVGLAAWHSVSNMLVRLCVRSFQDTHRILIYTLYDRVNNRANILWENLRMSEVFVMCNVRRNYGITEERSCMFVNIYTLSSG